MAVLETIRNKFGILITVLIAVALLSFIIDPSSLLSAMNSGPTNNGESITVSKINGHNVSYNDFNSKVQLLSNENVDRNMVRSQVLMNLVNEYLYSANAKAAGFNVSDNELAEVLSGNIPSQLVATILGPDMTKSRLAEIEKNVANDASGRGRIEWNNIIDMVRADRYLQKYNTYMSKSAFENSLVVEDNIKNSNNVFDLEFVMVPFADAVDETIVVTEDEVKEYYNAHKNLFKSADTRTIDYMLVEIDAENIDFEAAKVDSVFAQIKNAEDFHKAAVDNNYFLESATLTMGSNTLESVANTENVTKWAFKESETGVVSTTFNISDEDKYYMAIALLTGANDTGYAPLEGEVVSAIKTYLSNEKAADKKFAEVSEAVKGLDDLKDIAKVLGTSVSTKKNMTFASGDLDMKLTGAASVAETGVVNAPLKGMNGIYVYKVTDRSEGSYYTDDDAKSNKNMIDAYYMLKYNYYVNQMAMYQVEDPGLVEDQSYLYF